MRSRDGGAGRRERHTNEGRECREGESEREEGEKKRRLKEGSRRRERQGEKTRSRERERNQREQGRLIERNQREQRRNQKNLRQFYALVSKAKSGLRHHYSVVIEKIDDNE